jgi:hypothetical protein
MRLRRLINIEQGLLDLPDDLGYRRRVLEDARAKKRRFDPLRSQRRNCGKLNARSRCHHQRDMGRVVVAARRNHRGDTAVLDAVRVRMLTLVQLRGSTQRERPQKCHGDKCRDKCTPAIR